MLTYVKNHTYAQKNKLLLRTLRKQYKNPIFIKNLINQSGDFAKFDNKNFSIKEIRNGNINLTFLASNRSTKIVIKKYLPFAKSNPFLKVSTYSSSLAEKEASYMKFVFGKTKTRRTTVPVVYGYSQKENTLLTKYLSSSKSLFYDLNRSKPSGGAIGEFLRQIHEIKFVPGLRINERKKGTFESMVIEFAKKENLSSLYKNVSNWINEYEKAPKYLTHGDFSPKNILQNGTNINVIDFENMMYDDVSRDIGQFMGDMINSCIRQYFTFDLLRKNLELFLQTYKTTSPQIKGWHLLLERSRNFAGIVLIYRSLNLYPTSSKQDGEKLQKASYEIGKNLILSKDDLFDTISLFL